MLQPGRKVLASPAPFQFSHARSSQCARVSSGSQLCTRLGHASRRQAGDLRPQHRADSLAAPPTQRSRGQGLGTSRPRAGAAPRVRDTPAATPTGGAVTGAPALRVPQPTSARPRAHHLSGRRARTRARAPGQQAPRPAPKESLARAARKPRQMEALPEGGPYAGGVGAFDLLQDPLVLRDRAQSLAALRHLGWKRRRRPGGRARRRADRRSERQVAQARRGSAGRGLRGGAGPVWVGRRGWGPPLGR